MIKVTVNTDASKGINLDEYFKQKEELHAKMKLSMDDVWGDHEKGVAGMIVARSDERCPIFKDKVPYKSVTVVCDKEYFEEVCYWLSYVHGGSYTKSKDIGNGRIAIRSDYQCW